jgi:7-cyano-7-deazaguanine synthase
VGLALSTSATLVLFSGGQDSATVLAWALANYERVETVGFDYGQKHSVEMAKRPIIRNILQDKFPEWSKKLGPDHVVKVDLIGQITAAISPYVAFDGLVPKFQGRRYIPGRNLVFLSISASVAYRRSIDNLACGASDTEYSGYPDCKRQTMQAIQAAIREASGINFEIKCPLMNLDKAGVWDLAYTLGGRALVEVIRTETHSCYAGIRDELREWGYGCGECDACRLRRKGWSEFSEQQTKNGRQL